MWCLEGLQGKSAEVTKEGGAESAEGAACAEIVVMTVCGSAAQSESAAQ